MRKYILTNRGNWETEKWELKTTYKVYSVGTVETAQVLRTHSTLVNDLSLILASLVK